MSETALWHDAFYRLVPLDDPAALASDLRAWAAPLLGCLWVAPEGLNGVVAGTASELACFQRELMGSDRWGPLMAGMVFKRSACDTPPFQRLKIMCPDTLLPLEMPLPQEAIGDARVPPATSLSPQAWRELIRQDDVLVLDNRNSFEFRLGRFKGAVDPQVQHFRDFPTYVKDHLPQWQAQGQRVAMYCTGGIRCDKTSAWLNAMGLTVYSLEGGILNYFAQVPDAQQDWEGECFVFDSRIALDTQLRETPTTAEEVFDAPDDAWRLARAKRLSGEP
jgi:UPF0176 protein